MYERSSISDVGLLANGLDPVKVRARQALTIEFDARLTAVDRTMSLEEQANAKRAIRAEYEERLREL